MPSKYGFGNSRKVSPNKLSTYGSDNKNPIQQGGLPGTWGSNHPTMTGFAHNRASDDKTRFTLGADATFGGTGKGSGKTTEIKTNLSLKPGVKFGAHGKLNLEGTRTYKSKGLFGKHSEKSKTFLGVGGKLNVLGSTGKNKWDDQGRLNLSLSGNYGKTIGKKGFGGEGKLSLGFGAPGGDKGNSWGANVFAEKGFGNKGKKNTKVGANINYGGFNIEAKKDLKTGKTNVMGGLKLNL